MTKKVPLHHSIISTSSIVLSILIFVLAGFSAFWGILTGIIICIIFGKLNGYSIKSLLNMGLNGLKDSYIVLIIMSLIGIVISTWMVSGTIPSLMYYGFNYLSNINFLLASFLISSSISLILGTSIGTISTAGIPLMGISLGLGVPPHITAGAIVSGAFLGDRTSPMSSSSNLNSIITKTNLYDNIKHMIGTLFPVFIISSIFYYTIGKEYVLNKESLESINNIKTLLEGGFNIGLIPLIPPFVIIILSFFKINIKYNITLGILLSIIIGGVYQAVDLNEILNIGVLGYHPNGEISKIISGGGLVSMKVILLTVSLATALYGILEGTGIIEPVIDKFKKNINSSFSLIYKTSLLSILLNLITLNQTLAIIIPGKSMAKSFNDLGVSKNTLARTIGDTGTVTAPLVPFNINGLIISLTLGVSVISYVPYAILCYLLPISTLIFAKLKLYKKEVLRNN